MNKQKLINEPTRIKPYLAAPLFNPDQNHTLDVVEGSLETLGFKYFSPRKEGGTNFDKSEPQEVREQKAQKIFDSNIEGIKSCDMMLANIDDRDTGTAWEMGVAFASGIPLVSYSAHNYGANIMLSRSVMAHFLNLDDLKVFLQALSDVKVDTIVSTKTLIKLALIKCEELGINFSGKSNE